MLTVVALALAAIAVVALPRVPWPALFNVVSPQACAEAGPAMSVFAACFLVGLPLGVVPRIQLGHQEGYINSLWQAAGSVGGLAAVLVAIRLGLGLPWLVAGAAGAPLLASLLNAAVLFRRRPALRPSRASVSRATLRRLVHLGSLFLVLQIAAVLIFLSDNLIIAHLLGAAQVPEYAVPARLFGFAPLLVGMVLGPLWPAYGEARARGDMPWIRRTLGRSLRLALLATGIPAFILVLFGRPLLHLWVGAAVAPGFPLLLGLGVAVVLGSCGDAVAAFLNGISAIRFQAVTATLTALVAIAAKLILGLNAGIVGVVAGTVLAYAACTALPMCVYVPRELRRLGIGLPAPPRSG